ncbi:MAG TPA: hypothetical protein VFQ91_24180 [Bryobacteraceae bacterium]|nr:hypothetical protein [Bryobacteraceae bacterium]
MQRILWHYKARRIASFLFGLALLSNAIFAEESFVPRLASPVLGWVLTAGGTRAMEIAGIAESPRTGSEVVLPAAAQHLWSAPDAHAALVQAGEGLHLLRSGAEPERIAEIPAGTDVSAAWDRGSSAVVACWATVCRAWGSVDTRWEAPAGAVVLAYSVEAGLAIAVGDQAEWRNGNGVVALPVRPLAAAFRPGTQELWTAGPAGGLTMWTSEGSRTVEAGAVPEPVGLAMAADGSALFIVNAEGLGAKYGIASQQTESVEVGDAVEGVWPAPGAFAVRLHDSAKRAIAIWNGETGQTTWMPIAASAEVRQ